MIWKRLTPNSKNYKWKFSSVHMNNRIQAIKRNQLMQHRLRTFCFHSETKILFQAWKIGRLHPPETIWTFLTMSILCLGVRAQGSMVLSNHRRCSLIRHMFPRSYPKRTKNHCKWSRKMSTSSQALALMIVRFIRTEETMTTESGILKTMTTAAKKKKTARWTEGHLRCTLTTIRFKCSIAIRMSISKRYRKYGRIRFLEEQVMYHFILKWYTRQIQEFYSNNKSLRQCLSLLEIHHHHTAQVAQAKIMWKFLRLSFRNLFNNKMSCLFSWIATKLIYQISHKFWSILIPLRVSRICAKSSLSKLVLYLRHLLISTQKWPDNR